MKIILLALNLLFQQTYAQSKQDKKTKTPSQKTDKALQVSPAQMDNLIHDESLKKEVLIKKLTPLEATSLTPQDVDRIARQEEEKSGVTTNANFNIGVGGGKGAALLIFAIVGIVVIVMWIPYFPTLIYEATQKPLKYHFINYLSLKSSSISNSDSYNEERSGHMHGFNYSFYLNKRESDEFLQLGFTGELGSYNFDEESYHSQNHKNYHGGYYLIGPSMIIAKSNQKITDYDFFTKLDLLAGSSFSGDLGLLSKAEISLNLTYASGFTMGLGVGGLYIDVNKKRGILSETDNIGLTISGSLGYMF